MKISMYSCINSIIISTIIFICLSVARKRYQYSHISEVYVFLFLYTMGMCRLIFPFDFFFTTGVPIKGIFSNVFYFLFISKIKLPYYSISLGTILLFFIVLVSIYKMLNYILLYNKISKQWNLTEFTDRELLCEIHIQLKEKKFRIPNCIVASSPDVFVPVVTGVFKKKVILPTFRYTYQELYYILLHEYTHLCHYDFLKKFLLELLFSFFWWLPLSDFIKKDFEHSYEIRCDNSILKLCSDDEKLNYMETLVKSLKRSYSYQDNKLETAIKFILNDRPHQVIERFHVMTNKRETRVKISLCVTVIMLFCMFFISYAIVPFPSYEVPEKIQLCENMLSSETSSIKEINNIYYVITDSGECVEIPKTHIKNLIEMGIPLYEKESQ